MNIRALILTLLVVAFYSPVTEFEFLNFDDNLYITENPQVREGLRFSGIWWAFTHAHGGHWHPASWISHMLDVELFGLTPGMHHLVNVVLHGLNTALLFLLVTRWRLCGALGAAALAMIFAVHPLRLESVAWITERKDVLALLGILTTLHLYTGYTQRSKQGWIPYGGSLLALTGALLAKPSAVVVPALLFLIDWFPLRREIPIFKRIGEKVPHLLLVLLGTVAAFQAQDAGGGLKSLTDYPLDARIATALVGVSIYLGKFFFPTGQGIFYPYELYQPGVAAGAFCLMVILSVMSWQQREKRPYLAFGWCWFLISLVPVIGLVQIGGQSYADRWSYLPHIGLLIAVGIAVQQSASKNLARALATAALGSAAFLTYIQLPAWKSSESIFRHTLQVTPENFMAEMNLGLALQDQGRHTEALVHLERATLLRPFYPDALNNLAVAKLRINQVGEAEVLLRRALAANPSYTTARSNLVRLLLRHGFTGGALEVLLQGDPSAPELQLLVSEFVARGCGYFERSWRGISDLRRFELWRATLPASQSTQFARLENCVQR